MIPVGTRADFFRALVEELDAKKSPAPAVVEVSDTPQCEMCNDEGVHMDARLYPSGHTEVTVYCTACGGNLAGEVVF